jgi:hypothetical protein
LIRWKNISPEEVPNNDMENRVDRKNDESLYQPKIHSERIRTLYNLKLAAGKPMTVLLDQAILDFAANHGFVYHPEFEEEPILEKVDTETWEEVREYRGFLDQLDYQKCLDEVMRSPLPQVSNSPFENATRR